MTTSYANNLRIAEIGTGDQAGVWGVTTNYNLATLLGEAIAGYTSVAVTSTLQALTAYNGVSDQSRQAFVNLTGTPGGAAVVCIPPATKSYIIKNNTNQVVAISAATALNGTTVTGGNTVSIPSGSTANLYCDGTNVYDAANYVSTNMLIGGGLIAGGNGAFIGTGGLQIPVGTTAQQAGSTGTIRYNTTLSRYEGYNGSVWGGLGGGATGGGTNQAFFENDKIITVSYTISAGKNAMSAGNITLATAFAGTATLNNGGVGAGSILNVASATAGALYIGTVVTGSGIPANTTIISFGTGSGGIGTYNVSTSASIFAPVSIASTVVVTVPSGSKWTVVG
jgi:hypothetical protein